MSQTKKNKILISILYFSIIVMMSATVLATSIGPVTVQPNTSGNGVEVATTIVNSIIGILQVVGILL